MKAPHSQLPPHWLAATLRWLVPLATHQTAVLPSGTARKEMYFSAPVSASTPTIRESKILFRDICQIVIFKLIISLYLQNDSVSNVS